MTALRAVSVLIGGTLMLNACGSNSIEGQRTLATVPPIELAPRVEVGTAKVPIAVGDILVYNNPVEQWEVRSIDNGSIAWRSTRGGSKLSTLSPLLPSLRWFNGNDSYMSGVRELIDLSRQVHPIAAGDQYSFRMREQLYGDALRQDAYWSCKATNEVAITVPAGSLNTIEVLCNVNGKERMLMNYAPDLGHVVRYVMVLENGEKAERQLTGFARSPK